LVITDDNLTEMALRAVVESDLKIGRDIDVVTHCNWPAQNTSGLPVHYLGFDVQQILAKALTSLAALQRGENVGAIQLLPAVASSVPISPVY
jgi:DNA-binding LacI/PurR family transcriptional regulator